MQSDDFFSVVFLGLGNSLQKKIHFIGLMGKYKINYKIKINIKSLDSQPVAEHKMYSCV